MTVVRLHRNAPEAHNATTCEVCGTGDVRAVTDHILVGTPGTPAHDGGVCDACGKVLNNVVEKFGGELRVMVEDAQHEASERDITVHSAQPNTPVSEGETGH